MDLSFFEDCAKPNVLFNKEVFSLIKLRHVSNLVLSPPTKATLEREENTSVLDPALI